MTPLAWGMTAALAGTIAANLFYLTMTFYYVYVFAALALALPVVFGRGLAETQPSARLAVAPGARMSAPTPFETSTTFSTGSSRERAPRSGQNLRRRVSPGLVRARRGRRPQRRRLRHRDDRAPDDGAAERASRTLHAAIYELPVAWAQHLEGSYIPKDLLRHVDPARTPCLYLDNGARTLVWSDHCNNAHTRWLLREHGVVLTGPEPAQLVDPVSQEALREGASRALDEYAAEARENLPFSRWQQPYLVLTFCRLLWTLHHGAVTTKRDAGEWALGELDPEWKRTDRPGARRPRRSVGAGPPALDAGGRRAHVRLHRLRAVARR